MRRSDSEDRDCRKERERKGENEGNEEGERDLMKLPWFQFSVESEDLGESRLVTIVLNPFPIVSTALSNGHLLSHKHAQQLHHVHIFVSDTRFE